MASEQCDEAGITENVIRLCVGIESADDIAAKFKETLDVAQPRKQTTESTPGPVTLRR